MTRRILTLNVGSSSVKFGLYGDGPEPVEDVRGEIEDLGGAPRLRMATAAGEALADERPGAAGTHAEALGAILALLGRHRGAADIAAVGHRVVHGGPAFAAPAVLDDAALEALAAYAPLAPLHQPHNLAGIAAARAAFPTALQVGCFDTAFHRHQPWVNDTYALPRRYYDAGVRRYGFHGLSYEYVMEELRRIAPEAARGKVVIAHLGNGASMCAVENGRGVASTMGFSPLDGLPMGTRTGQIDPGVLLHLMTQEGLDAAALGDLLYRHAGLKGLSGLSHDVRELEAAGTPEAQGALDYFVARVRRELGSLAAALGGLDALVFTGGIGENAWRLRAAIGAGMDWLGLALGAEANRASRTAIAAPGARVGAFVIRTNEQTMIARHTARVMERSGG